MNPMRIAATLLLALVLGCLVAGSAAAAPSVSIPIEPNAPEVEPNDNFDTAQPVRWGSRIAGSIGMPGDADMLHFEAYGQMADTLSFEWTQYRNSPLKAQVTLYDEYHNLIADYSCAGIGVCFEYRFASDYYHRLYVRVTDVNGNGGPTYAYALRFVGLGPTDPNEPNDTPDGATPLVYDQPVVAVMGCEETDYYRFDGRVGDEIYIYKYQGNGSLSVELLDTTLNPIDAIGQDDSDIHLDLPADGRYYLKYQVADTYACDFGYKVTVDYYDQPVYLSFATGGFIQGISFTSGDVLRYWTRSGRWEMYLDMSDLGLNGNLVALGKNEWYDFFYFTFAAKYTLPNVGVVYPQDAVEMSWPESVGEDTQGTVKFFFDGSDVGLTGSGERIDTLANASVYGPWYYGTSGQARVPFGLGELVLANEDIGEFEKLNSGQDTAGTWRMVFDGSTYGFGAANLTSADIGGYWDYDYYQDSGTVYWLSFDRRVKLNGVTVDPGDIVACYESREDEDLLCNNVKLLLDASRLGLGTLKIDAFEVGVKQ